MAVTPNSAPVPRDPRKPKTTPEQVDARVAEILSEPTADLKEEADMLARAHAVVHDALN